MSTPRTGPITGPVATPTAPTTNPLLLPPAGPGTGPTTLPGTGTTRGVEVPAAEDAPPADAPRDPLYASVAELRRQAEERRQGLAIRAQNLKNEWDGHQAEIQSLRKRHQEIVKQMDALSATLDPIVDEHDRLFSAVKQFDSTLGTLGGNR